MLVIPQTKQNLVASRRRHILRIKILSHVYWKNSLYRTQILFIESIEEEVHTCLEEPH